ncbi:MAG: helix-turn-helix transcriptional regulator [Acholeplasmataceae bacterium]|nr:helix-turn-helix transcriptional regulator [Acholeplasmataceae bacterium]
MYIQLQQIKKQLNYRKTQRSFETLPLGSAMKFRRKELNMTLEETAENLISISYLSKLENNLIKPNMKYIKLFEERLKMKFDQHNYDHNYHHQINQVFLSLHHDEKIEEELLNQYKQKQNHQSFLFVMAHYVSSNQFDKIKPYYENLKSYIPNLLNDEIILFFTCVTIILISEERFLDAYEVIKLIPKTEEENILIESIKLKYRLKCVIGLMRPSEVEKVYHQYVSNLQIMHAFDQLYKTQIEYFVYKTSQHNIEKIEERLNKIPAMDSMDRSYILALCYYHSGNYEKSLFLSQSYIDSHEKWLILHIMSLDHLHREDDIKGIIQQKESFVFSKRSDRLIFRYIEFKHFNDTKCVLSYLRELLTNRYLLTDNYHTLSYIYKDAAALFGQHFYYKEAHQTLHQWFIVQKTLTKSS